MSLWRSLIIVTMCLVTSVATALDTRVPLKDPGQQALYERLTKEVRCLVCQNQTIADSTAPLAADLRREIYRMVAAGQSEKQIKAFLTDRYGDFVLYKPRFGGPATLLWLAPVLLLIFGAFVLWRVLRRRASLPVNLDEVPSEPEPRDGMET
jgi:cytochrome c-type biogenesis protein CcmH